MSRTQNPKERVEAMSDREQVDLLRRVADDSDDESIARILEIGAHSIEESMS